ncbi:HNH endonuclease [Caulobacter sp. DWP3-1-3b2]|uniref:HNH endonuclease n=1 Tax=Caulobacter sp. DWP3-1-3b2 TaxID=2804643 RepID=UPI003CEA1BE1
MPNLRSLRDRGDVHSPQEAVRSTNAHNHSPPWHEHIQATIKLHWAQRGLCAGCGRSVPRVGRFSPDDPMAPTFDHVIPASRGGRKDLGNGLMKHQSCNVKRGDAPPTGCDLIWQALVAARLALEGHAKA